MTSLCQVISGSIESQGAFVDVGDKESGQLLWVACVSSVGMIYVQEYIDGQPNPLPIEQRTKKGSSQRHLIHTINSGLATLRFTSSPRQSQHLHFGAKQMALQCYTNEL
ncbi:hypothetical protein SCLCIDRAFT_1050728 [Scleroderma citrinum Foug A]|uniref:Uncharacterized protein n=1 Tax=Scleroderma citrinum Foug A TaxID=1036808 RepID=A0A0C3DDW4_9AGAM|nr:hypothetical protein SCLCIDRAFT_1050728 [Scleroderma citrinum Foug A]